MKNLTKARLRWMLVAGVAGICTVDLRADVVLFSVPGTSAVMVLPEGEAKVQPGRTVSYSIPDIGTLTLSLETSRIIKSPSRKQLFKRQFGQAQGKKDIESILVPRDMHCATACWTNSSWPPRQPTGLIPSIPPFRGWSPPNSGSSSPYPMRMRPSNRCAN